MKIIDLVPYLKGQEILRKFYEEKNINSESEEISIYMQNEISIDSDIYFFDIDETDGEVEYQKDNNHFIYFFPLEHAMELVTDELNLLKNQFTDSQIAERLIEYRLYDA